VGAGSHSHKTAEFIIRANAEQPRGETPLLKEELTTKGVALAARLTIARVLNNRRSCFSRRFSFSVFDASARCAIFLL